MKKLYKFYWGCGRMGHVEGVFVEDDAEVAKAIGLRVNFGEILGKHSQVNGVLKEKDLKVLTDDADFIAKAQAFGLVPSGYNPMRYLRCTCGAMIEEEECAPDCERGKSQ